MVPRRRSSRRLGGFLQARLGHIPKAGETHREAGLLFTVEEADRRRVHRVKVEAEMPSSVGESKVQVSKSKVDETAR